MSGAYSAKTIIKVIKKTTFRTNSHARVSQDYTNRAGKWNDLTMTPMTQPLQPTHGTQPTKIVLLKGTLPRALMRKLIRASALIRSRPFALVHELRRSRVEAR